MYRAILFSLALLLLTCTGAQAGQLFPPDNASGAVTCPSGQVLKWVDNSVQCADPTPGVNVSKCPSGQVMQGITGGTANCVAAAGTTSIMIYQCPVAGGCSNGQTISGAWASYGCIGQIGSLPTCVNSWWNSGGHSCTNPCTALGRVIVQP